MRQVRKSFDSGSLSVMPFGSGFSTVELLTVMVVSMVVAVMAAPSFSRLMATIELKSATNALFYSLLLARSEAIKRNDRVVVCKSTTELTCATSGGWEQGWLVFIDVNNNARVDAGEEVIQYQPKFRSTIRITGNLPIANYVSYKGSGTTSQLSGAFQAGTITACQVSPHQVDSQKLIVSGVGKVRQVKVTVPNC